MINNPNWQEANQFAILQALPRIWTQDYQAWQIQLVARAGLELRAYELHVQVNNKAI